MDCLKKVVACLFGRQGRVLSTYLVGKKSVSSMTKGESTMKNRMIGLVMVMMLAAGTAFAADTEVVDIYVTPGAVAASLLANPTWYNFGIVNLTASSNTAVAMTLTNNGSCGCTVQGEISANPSDWTATAANPVTLANQYRLWVGTATSRVGLNGFDAACNLGALNNPINLCNASGGTGGGTIIPDASVNLWFQIDMPQDTNNSDERKAQVTFTATTK